MSNRDQHDKDMGKAYESIANRLIAGIAREIAGKYKGMTREGRDRIARKAYVNIGCKLERIEALMAGKD